MITKGIIIKQSNKSPNKYIVRIPIFETATTRNITSDLSSSHMEATLSANPGTVGGFLKDDVVFIGFEDNSLSKPIILGKLMLGNEMENDSRAYEYINALKVTHNANLPVNTTIGTYSWESIIGKLNSLSNILDSDIGKVLYNNANGFEIENNVPIIIGDITWDKLKNYNCVYITLNCNDRLVNLVVNPNTINATGLSQSQMVSFLDETNTNIVECLFTTDFFVGGDNVSNLVINWKCKSAIDLKVSIIEIGVIS